MRRGKIAFVGGEPAYIKKIQKLGTSKAIILPADWFWAVGNDVEEVSMTFGKDNELIVKPYRRGKGARLL